MVSGLKTESQLSQEIGVTCLTNFGCDIIASDHTEMYTHNSLAETYGKKVRFKGAMLATNGGCKRDMGRKEWLVP